MVIVYSYFVYFIFVQFPVHDFGPLCSEPISSHRLLSVL